MKFSTSTFIRVIGACAMLFQQSIFPALAQDNWQRGKDLYVSNNCASCHRINGNDNSKILIAGKDKNDISTAIATQSLMSEFSSLTQDEISDLGAYLGRTSFPVAELTAMTTGFFGSISVGSTASRSFELRNPGDASLVVNSVGVDDTTNYAVAQQNCTSTPVLPGDICTVQVTFSPQSIASFNGRKLTIGHDAIGDGASSTASPPRGTSSVTLSGTGLVPFTVAPSAPLPFTPATAPVGTTRTVTITDNKGDRIRVCRVTAALFDAPQDFSFDAPTSLDADACFTSAAGAAPRQISLVVRFVPGGSGPRFAKLTFQRLNTAGNATGSMTVLELQGNPGAVVALDASSLFDASADQGVEVDGDATLSRPLTLFSKGTEPLVFNGSTFTISGPNSSEYTIAGTGCKILSQLPALTSDIPPSCVLTVVFNPSDVGQRGPANLTIRIPGVADNVVTLNGLGFRGPRLAARRGVAPLVSGDVIEFGAQTIGGIYQTIPVTLTNGGTRGNLDVVFPAAASIAGFLFKDPGTCGQLAPGAGCVIALHFDPKAVRAYSASFPIQTRSTGTNDPVRTFELDLRGQGSMAAIPALSWTDATGVSIGQFAFADTSAGAPVTTKMRLYNAGPGGARLQFGNAIGSDSANFALDTSNCAKDLELFEGTSCEVAVTFAPSTAGQKSASLQFVAEAGTPSAPVLAPYLAITGKSRAAATPALLQPSASALQFSNTVVGSSSAPTELRLTNSGSRALTVLSLDIDSPFGVQVRTCTSVPFLLLPGAECAVNVTFAPQAEGNAAGELRIATDSAPSPQQISLTGTGQAKADVSGGGCSMVSGDTLADPVLWALVLLAFAALRYRRRGRSRLCQRP